MKKLLAILLTLALVVTAFAACNNDKKTNDTTDLSAENVSEENKTDKPVLTMVTNASFPPYEYVEGDEIVGIDAEVAQVIADKLGMELKIVDVEFDSIVPGVQNHKYDMGMAGLTITKERLEKVNFSDSYAKGIQAVIVKEGSDIKTVDDLEGKKIGVQTATTGDIYASDTYGEENVVKMANAGLAVEALKAGKIDAVIIDNEPAKTYVSQNEGLTVLEEEFANEDYAICFAKDNAELQTKVNDALKELIADGTVKAIVDKYIPAE